MSEDNELFGMEIFKGKSFSKLLKDIYTNSKNKERQISILIDELRPLVKTLGDATVIVPLIKEYLDVGVKNDEILVKMAGVAQRAMQSKSGVEDGYMGLTQEEMDELEHEHSVNTKKLEETTERKSKIQKSISGLEKKVDNILEDNKKSAGEKSAIHKEQIK